MPRVIFGLGSISYLGGTGILPAGVVVPFDTLLTDLLERHIPEICARVPLDLRLLANCVLAAAYSDALLGAADGWFTQRQVQLPGGGTLCTQGWKGAQLRHQLGEHTDAYDTLPPGSDAMAAITGLGTKLPDVLDVGTSEAKLYRSKDGWEGLKVHIPAKLWEDVRAQPESWRDLLANWLHEVLPPLGEDTICFATGLWRTELGDGAVQAAPGPLVRVLSQEEEARNEWHAVCSAAAAARTLGVAQYVDVKICGYLGYGGGSTQGFVGSSFLYLPVGLSAVLGELREEPTVARAAQLAKKYAALLREHRLLES
jgi:hypothetical protein